MIKSFVCLETLQRRGDVAVHYNGKLFDNLVRVAFHVVLYPVQHKPHKGIFVEIRNELFVLGAN